MRTLSKKTIIKKLDKLVTQILLQKEKKCVVCGSTSQLGNGHIFSRRYLNTRWDISDEGNCHIQCWSCNSRHTHNTYPYNNWYINKFGNKKFDILYQRWNTICKLKPYELEELRKTLENKIIQDIK